MSGTGEDIDQDDVIKWDEKLEDHTLAVLEGDLEEDSDADIENFEGTEGVAKVNTEKYVTDFEEAFEFQGSTLEISVDRDGGPKLELDREEDYHLLRSPGIIETLVETQLPMECRQNSNIIWLTSVIMAEIAQNQAFSEGSKRTAYMTGTLFLIKAQLIQRENAVYPMLDKELTDKLSDLAIDKTGEEYTLDKNKFYEYLKNRLRNQAEM